MLNRVGSEQKQDAPKLVTLPTIKFTDTEIEMIEAREAAARITQRKVIRAGIDAWRKATGGKTARADDRVKAAGAAWRRFVACVEALPSDQAVPFWREAQAQAAAVLAMQKELK